MENRYLLNLYRQAQQKLIQTIQADFRFIDPEEKALTCIKKNAFEASQMQRRLQVASHLELLFSNDELCGWSLLRPTAYIVAAWEEPSFADDDELFPTLVYEYLQLVTDPYIELTTISEFFFASPRPLIPGSKH